MALNKSFRARNGQPKDLTRTIPRLLVWVRSEISFEDFENPFRAGSRNGSEEDFGPTGCATRKGRASRIERSGSYEKRPSSDSFAWQELVNHELPKKKQKFSQLRVGQAYTEGA